MSGKFRTPSDTFSCLYAQSLLICRITTLFPEPEWVKNKLDVLVISEKPTTLALLIRLFSGFAMGLWRWGVILVSILTTASLAAPLDGGDSQGDKKTVLFFSDDSYYTPSQIVQSLDVALNPDINGRGFSEELDRIPEWLAYIKQCNKNTQCGSAVISEEWALAQASCFFYADRGEMQLVSVGSGRVLSEIEGYLPLPGYYGEIWDDLALVKLEQNPDLREYPVLDTFERHNNSMFEELAPLLKHFDNQGRNVSLSFDDAEKTFSRRTTNASIADYELAENVYYYELNITVPLYYFIMDEIHERDTDYSRSTSIFTEGREGFLLIGLCSPFLASWRYPLGRRGVSCQAISDFIQFIISQTYGRESLPMMRNTTLPAVNGNLTKLLVDLQQLENLKPLGKCNKVGIPVSSVVALVSSGGVVVIVAVIGAVVGIEKLMKYSGYYESR